MDTIEKQKTEKATRPASRWRNKFLILRNFIACDGEKFRRDQIVWGRLWPSRDVAETSGQTYEANWPHNAKYLGAFPVDA